MTRALATTLACAVLFVAGAARADEPTDAERSLARREYKSGVEAAEAGRWERARSAFERAYELVGVPAILYNLAGAQAQTGLLVEAAESYRKFLREGTDAQSQPLRGDAQSFLEELEPRIPAVRIGADGLLDSDRLLVDGETISHAAVGGELPLNPGTHAIAVKRQQRIVAEAEVTLAEGQTEQVQLDVPAPTPEEVAYDQETKESGGRPWWAGGDGGGGGTTSDPGGDGGKDDGSAWTSPWLWTAVGAAVLGGAAAAIVLTRPEGQSPYESTLPTIDFR